MINKIRRFFGRENYKKAIAKHTALLKDFTEPGFCCIGITDSCFFKCKMCEKWKTDISVTEKSHAPKIEHWKKFIFELSQVVPKKRLEGDINQRFEVNFAGGESLTHPFTLPLVKYASTLGFRTVIPSNGYLVNEEMAKKLNEAGLSAINFSLDSLDPKIHDEFRGFNGAHKGVMKAIECISKYRYPEAGIITIIHGKTYTGTVNLVKWVSDHPKLNWVNVMAIMQPNNTVFQSGWYKEFDYLWPEDTHAVINEIDNLIQIKKEHMKKTKAGIWPNDKLVNTMPQLHAFRNYFLYPETFVKNERSCNLDNAIQVSAVGDVYMCYHYQRLGNIHEDNFTEIWKSTRASIVRDKIKLCKTNCHELINCYYKDEYPFSLLQE